jgi:Domain of unknown function (DUF4157)
MTTLADYFASRYRTDIDFSAIRLHYVGADKFCRAFGARALSVGADIYFRDGAFAPHTRDGLRLLAHEVAHVVQQRRGPVRAIRLPSGTSVAPGGGPQEREAEAAADALLCGRSFDFGARSGSGSGAGGDGWEPPVVQRYMAWEHGMLGDMDPAFLSEAAGPDSRCARTGLKHIEAHCALLEQLGRAPRDIDEERLRAGYPGLETIRLPGSGLVVTLGELNMLPDYLSDPGAVETAPAAFLEPLIQSLRNWSITELNRRTGRPGPRLALPGSLKYARGRWFTEIREAIEVDELGRGCGFAPWELYSSVVGRNAGHFAPFSWYRWQTFHLAARDLIARSRTAAADEREVLRTRARVYAGYADHFLHDSFAAGHLINKTLVMQWYLEWLAGSRIPYPDGRLLRRVTAGRQPLLHGPNWYETASRFAHNAAGPARSAECGRNAHAGGTRRGERRGGGHRAGTTRCVRRIPGAAVQQRRAARGRRRAPPPQRALAGCRGERGRQAVPAGGDWNLLDDAEGALRAAEAAAASRRAICELPRTGETDVTAAQIFEMFPDHVEQNGALLTLRQWHDSGLRELCLGELFGHWRTRMSRLVLTASLRRLGVPSEDAAALLRS